LFNSPSILNVNKNYYIGWKGKYSQLKPQLEMIFENPKIMGTDWPFVISAFKNDTLYSTLFSYLYDDGVSKENIIDAVLYYESNLILPSKFDEFLLGDTDAISLSAKQGYNKFKDYGCASCHQGANVGGNLFQKLGVTLPYKGIKGNYKAEKLRVPSLRNVALTAPYLHNGSVPTMYDLLLPAKRDGDPDDGEYRPDSFQVGSREFDPVKMGFQSSGYDGFNFQTLRVGDMNTGHEYGAGRTPQADGTQLPPLTKQQRYDLVEYIKTL
jgi:cytochrome c peroxidase